MQYFHRVKKNIFFLLMLLSSNLLLAQIKKDPSLINLIDELNRSIEKAVVEKQIGLLQKHYAEDFVFTHGTGLVDSKKSWLKNVADSSVHYLSRLHDSIVVEVHKNIAIVSGTLTVKRQLPASVSRYALRYLRVFAVRKKYGR